MSCEPLVKVSPATGPCRREVRLDTAGKPIYCDKPGCMKVGDSPTLCATHATEQMKITELTWKTS